MTPNRTASLVGGLLLTAQLSLPGTAAAEPYSPLYRLVDTAAQRLETADPVAAFKWINGGPITDPQRAGQVLDAAADDASARGIDQQYVRAVFTDQIAATEGIEYTRFGQWKFDGTTAPTAAPDLSASRTEIDGFNKTMVEEIALQWNSLHSPRCGQELADATGAVAAARRLDDLYREALTSATRSYCRST
jgi:chorismate mutase